LVGLLAGAAMCLARLSSWLWRQGLVDRRAIRLGMRTAFRINRTALELLRRT